MSSHYAPQLARLHHEHFGHVARSAAALLLDELSRHNVTGGTIVELACGSGISSRLLSEAGYDVVGVDISEAMLAIAQAQAPNARFAHGSLWDFSLPPCVAVTAIGEAFSYATTATVGLEQRFREIAGALAPEGLLLFDVAIPGRSGPAQRRLGAWEHEGAFVFLDEREDPSAHTLERTIDSFVPEGELHRHSRELHRLTLHAPEAVFASLEHAGLSPTRLDRYGDFTFLPGWVGFLAVKR